MSGSPNTTNRLPLAVVFSASAICRSGFIRAFRTGMRPNRSNSAEWASKLKAQATTTSNRHPLPRERQQRDRRARRCRIQGREKWRHDVQLRPPDSGLRHRSISPGHGTSDVKAMRSSLWACWTPAIFRLSSTISRSRACRLPARPAHQPDRACRSRIARVDRQDAMRRQALDRERAGDADARISVQGLSYRYSNSDFGRNRSVDFLLPRDARCPPLGM